MSGHTDSPYGYYIYNIEVERDPRIDFEALTDAVFSVVDSFCEPLSVGDECAIEHYASGSASECLFPDEYGNQRHISKEGEQ